MCPRSAIERGKPLRRHCSSELSTMCTAGEPECATPALGSDRCGCSRCQKRHYAARRRRSLQRHVKSAWCWRMRLRAARQAGCSQEGVRRTRFGAPHRAGRALTSAAPLRFTMTGEQRVMPCVLDCTNPAAQRVRAARSRPRPRSRKALRRHLSRALCESNAHGRPALWIALYHNANARRRARAGWKHTAPTLRVRAAFATARHVPGALLVSAPASCSRRRRALCVQVVDAAGD